ncbi:MAG: PAS domain-containing protein [Gemmatimonadota bacterium]
MTDDFLPRLLKASAVTHYVELSRDGTVTDANAAFAGHMQASREEILGLPLRGFLTEAAVERFGSWLQNEQPPQDPVRVDFASTSGALFTLNCLLARRGDRLMVVGEPDSTGDAKAAGELMRLNNELATMARERARREKLLEKTRHDLEHALEELQTSYWHLQKVQEVLPICMGCGKIKGDKANWQTLADYLKDNEIFLSHGYCPSCEAAFLAEHGLDGTDT